MGWRFLARRLLFAIPTLFAVTLFSYVIAVSSGNHFWQAISDAANQHFIVTAQQVQQLELYYHLNQPALEGYFLWLADLLRGNFGQSIGGQPVLAAILPRVLPTVGLQVPAILTSVAVGTYVGVYSAGRYNSRLDRVLSSGSAMVLAVPAFWLATFSILVFSLHLHLFPSFGEASSIPPYWWGSPVLDVVAHYILPFSVLVAVSTPLYARLARASAVDVLSKDWVTATMLSGVKRSSLLYRHVLKNCLGPVLAALSVNLGVFLAASPGIEVAFSWPGLGLGFVQAAIAYDQPTMVAIILLMALITIAATVMIDIIQALVDPRVSL